MESWMKRFGIEKVNPGVFCGEWLGSGETFEKMSQIDGKVIASVRSAGPQDYETAVSRAHDNAGTLKRRGADQVPGGQPHRPT